MRWDLQVGRDVCDLQMSWECVPELEGRAAERPETQGRRVGGRVVWRGERKEEDEEERGFQKGVEI